MNPHLNRYKIYLTSPKSLLIEWDNKITPESIKVMQAFKNQLISEDVDIHFVTTAFKSILIKYKTENFEISNKKYQIETQIDHFKFKTLDKLNTNFFKIPVCYEDFGKDLQYISNQTGLNKPEIVQIHTQPIYTLYFIGFLPGFLYLGDVDKRIQIPRHQKPRPKVEKGSVGIAENQTGIYPMNSPGGWQIIGQTPLNLFDVNKPTPSPFCPGDQIQFYTIDKLEFEKLKNSDLPIEKFIQND